MQSKKGFTLIEVIIAIALVAIISVCVLSVSLSLQKTYNDATAKFFLSTHIYNVNELLCSAYNGERNLNSFDSAVMEIYDLDELNKSIDDNGFIYEFDFDSDYEICEQGQKVYEVKCTVSIVDSTWTYSAVAYNSSSRSVIYECNPFILGATL